MNHWSDSNVDLEMALNKACFFPQATTKAGGHTRMMSSCVTEPNAEPHFGQILKLKWAWNLSAAHLFKENISDTKFRYAAPVLLQVRRFVGVASLMAAGCLLSSNGKFRIFLLSFLLLHFFTFRRCQHIVLASEENHRERRAATKSAAF